ncbi:Mesaconyl-C(4)-CoA hydratase [Paramyrothecium foliicola]|nr:Mesaconyl-C(4)-CoA hydratase [Paramyrothecium foliicola]
MKITAAELGAERRTKAKKENLFSNSETKEIHKLEETEENFIPRVGYFGYTLTEAVVSQPVTDTQTVRLRRTARKGSLQSGLHFDSQKDLLECLLPKMALRSVLRRGGLSQLTSLRCRCFASAASQAPASTAAEAAASLMERYSGKTVVRRQPLDSNQLQKLLITLDRREPRVDDYPDLDGPAPRHQVPPGYHLVFFTPDDAEADLGADGTDTVFNPPAPFTRRMWAGGRMTWSPTTKLWTGQRVEERTRLLSATPKKSRSAGEMVLVEVEKEYVTSEGTPLVDRRSWIFRPAIDVDAALEMPKPIDADTRSPTMIKDIESKRAKTNYPVRVLRWSPVGLFRFSALTFNGHKIHYNEGWTQTVEGHPGVVVHGPLNLINILDYWRDTHGNGAMYPAEIEYRALSPIYAGEEYRIQTGDVFESGGQQTAEVLVVKDETVCLKAIVTGSAS